MDYNSFRDLLEERFQSRRRIYGWREVDWEDKLRRFEL